jgi:cyanophycinase
LAAGDAIVRTLGAVGSRTSLVQFRILFPIVICLAAIAAPASRAEDAAAAEPPKGRLLLMGGAEREDNPVLWNELLVLAGGTGARVAVFPTGSHNPEKTGAALSARLRRLGLAPFVVPVGELGDYPDSRRIVADPKWVERVRRADAVFLSAGMQSRYRRSLIDDRGKDTPLLEAIHHVYQRGGLVAGTSAGTAVMSHVMFVDADFVLPTMLNGTRLGHELDAGFGLAPRDWFIDQHALARGRFARALVAMQSQNIPFGLGVDEDSAVVIEQGRKARVVGYRGAVVLDLSQMTFDRAIGKFNLRKARLSYLSHGDQVDLATRAITVDPEKTDHDLVDPRKPGFEPYFEHRIFSNDILGNMALLDLMYKLVDSPYDEAIGLAYDGRAARRGNTPGFEFRFYRGEDTVSWNSHRAHGDSHTVKNVYLDIRPITIRGPLYE